MSTRSRDNSPPKRYQLKEKKHINVLLVNGDSMLLTYDRSTRLSEIFECVCGHAKINEHDLFGLAVYMDDCFHFLDVKAKVSKIDFKSIRKKTSNLFKSSTALDLAQSANASSAQADIPTIYFRVQFYVRSHTLRERATKRLYYEQLRANLLTYRLLCSEEVYFQLAALALQADHGTVADIKESYFDPKHYFPQWLLERYSEEYMRLHVPPLHRAQGRLSRGEAELRFIRMASEPPANFNMHLCRLLERATFDRKQDSAMWVGISPAGLELHEERNNGFLSHMSTLLWAQIIRLTYKKRRFILHMKGGRVMLLEAANSTQAEHLFWLCQRMHLYQTTAQLAAIHSPEAIQDCERRRFRESYIYTDQEDLEHRQRSDSNASSLYHGASNSISGTERPETPQMGFASLPRRPASAHSARGGSARRVARQRVQAVDGDEVGAAIARSQAAAVYRRAEERRRSGTPPMMAMAVGGEESPGEVVEDADNHSEGEITTDILDSSTNEDLASRRLSQLCPSPPPQFVQQVSQPGDARRLSQLSPLPPPQFRSHAESDQARNPHGINRKKLGHPPVASQNGTIMETAIDDSPSYAATGKQFYANNNYISEVAMEEVDEEAISGRLEMPARSCKSLNLSEEDAMQLGTSSPLNGRRGGLAKKSLSLDLADSNAPITPLMKELSRSFPLLTKLCEEFNEIDILRGARNLESSGLGGTAAMKSFTAETMHLDRIGHLSDDDDDNESENGSYTLNSPQHHTRLCAVPIDEALHAGSHPSSQFPDSRSPKENHSREKLYVNINSPRERSQPTQGFGFTCA